MSLHLLRYEDLNIEHIYLDGAPVARLNTVMRKIFAPVLVWQQDMIIKNREKGISDFVKRYGRDIAEHMADSFLKFDKESICHIGRDCVVGNTPDLSREIRKRIVFDWGEKELYTKTSMPLVKKIWPEAGKGTVVPFPAQKDDPRTLCQGTFRGISSTAKGAVCGIPRFP